MLTENEHSEWEWKAGVTNCHKCGIHLGIVHWKHHCRSCGIIFCAHCCSYLTELSFGEMSEHCPKRVLIQEPQKCCFACHDRIGQHIMEDDPNSTAHSRTLRGLLGFRVIEEVHQLPHINNAKVFALQTPSDGSIHSFQSVDVVLDGHRYTTTVPDVYPGETYYVRTDEGLLYPHHRPTSDFNPLATTLLDASG